MPTPHFLLVELPFEHAAQPQILRSLRTRIERERGVCWACEPAGRVVGLEPGTVAASLIIARFPDVTRLQRAVSEHILPHLSRSLPSGSVPILLAVPGLPEEGLPEMLDIPTAASVPRPPSTPRNAFLVIRGSASDSQRMSSYRDVILPMHKEHGGYYEVFAISGEQVQALSGRWTQQIFAISRWPSRVAAEAFWYSERYQQHAIPIRLGAGVFSVHMLEALDPI